MRRRWVLIGGGVCGLAVAALLALTKPPDKFAFIRKYNPTEERLQVGPLAQGAAYGLVVEPSHEEAPWSRTFSFTKESPELMSDLLRFKVGGVPKVYMDIRLTSGELGFYTFSNRRLTFENDAPPTWLDKQWIALKERLGF